MTTEDILRLAGTADTQQAEAEKKRTAGHLQASRVDLQKAESDEKRLSALRARLRERMATLQTESLKITPVIGRDVLTLLDDQKKRTEVTERLAAIGQRKRALDDQAAVLRLAADHMDNAELPAAQLRRLEAAVTFTIASRDWVLAAAVVDVGDVLRKLRPLQEADPGMSLSGGPNSKAAVYAVRISNLDIDADDLRKQIKALAVAQKG